MRVGRDLGPISTRSRPRGLALLLAAGAVAPFGSVLFVFQAGHFIGHDALHYRSHNANEQHYIFMIHR